MAALSRGGMVLMSLFLGLAAVVQLNDPDPIIWMTAYGLPALLTVWACVINEVNGSRVWRYLCVAVLSGEAVFALSVLFINTQKYKFHWNIISTEEGREMLGLLIVITWLLLLISNSKHRGSWFWEHALLTFAMLPVSAWVVYRFHLQNQLVLDEHCQGLL